MDSTPLFRDPTVKRRGYVSVAFGVAILAVGYYVDSIQGEMDFAFWLILAGCLSFSGGFVLLEPPSTVVRQKTNQKQTIERERENEKTRKPHRKN